MKIIYVFGLLYLQLVTFPTQAASFDLAHFVGEYHLVARIPQSLGDLYSVCNRAEISRKSGTEIRIIEKQKMYSKINPEFVRVGTLTQSDTSSLALQYEGYLDKLPRQVYSWSLDSSSQLYDWVLLVNSKPIDHQYGVWLYAKDISENANWRKDKIIKELLTGLVIDLSTILSDFSKNSFESILLNTCR